MLNLQLRVYSDKEIKDFIDLSLDTGKLKYDMIYVQALLKYLHSLEYKKENPQHSKEDTVHLISRFSKIFRGMILVRDLDS